ncbi:unnamed protein product [Linum tenue]|uniref:Uncharacterized protein n=1 Tax=Linum tenue TaxID=586396 RepID=A0AAV0J0S1_9ROSI|nr:unnamed protein product [Linum tenue]
MNKRIRAFLGGNGVFDSLESVEAALPKQKEELGSPEFRHGKVAQKRRWKAYHWEETNNNLLWQAHYAEAIAPSDQYLKGDTATIAKQQFGLMVVAYLLHGFLSLLSSSEGDSDSDDECIVSETEVGAESAFGGVFGSVFDMSSSRLSDGDQMTRTDTRLLSLLSRLERVAEDIWVAIGEVKAMAESRVLLVATAAVQEQATKRRRQAAQAKKPSPSSLQASSPGRRPCDSRRRSRRSGEWLLWTASFPELCGRGVCEAVEPLVVAHQSL